MTRRTCSACIRGRRRGGWWPAICVITEIYDLSGHGNNLTDAPGGGAAGGPDNLANATAAPGAVGGHEAYGVYVAPGTGYRDDSTTDTATGNEPEGEYDGSGRSSTQVS
jgi:hypothetical protein